MTIDRQLFKTSYHKDAWPAWRCSACSTGTISIYRNTFKHFESLLSKSRRGKDEWDPEWIEYRFTFFGRCTSSKCGEGYVVSGVGEELFSPVLDPYTGNYESSYTKLFKPHYICPCVAIFPISSKYPDPVQDHLRRAFSLFWNDHNASSNALRTCIEVCLDSISVPRHTYVAKKGKRKKSSLNLHQRIQRIPPKHCATQEILLAAKWLANAGSHSQNITRNDLFDALELVEHALEDIFENKRANMRNLAAKINSRKGPQKRKVLKWNDDLPD